MSRQAALLCTVVIVSLVFCQIPHTYADTTTSIDNSTTPDNSTITALNSTTAETLTTTPKPDKSTTTDSSTTTQKLSTTVQPSTTTHKSTTTAPPKDPPTFSVKNKDGKFCVVFQADIHVQFKSTNNQTVDTDLPTTGASSYGSCTDSTDLLTLEWTSQLGNSTEDSVNVSLTLNVSQASGGGSSYSLTKASVMYQIISNNSVNGSVSAPTDGTFKSTKGSYYLCDKTTSVTGTNLKIDFSKLKLLAFGTQEKSKFDGVTATDCAKGTTDTVVPIAVGCALAAMVLIVLIGYCIGRRRARPGYQQMAE